MMWFFRPKQQDILPCPFCHEKPTVSGWQGRLSIRCDTKGCVRPDTFSQVISYDLRVVTNRWNRRVERIVDNDFDCPSEIAICTCPFCGHVPVLRIQFGKLVIECLTRSCIQPSTWLYISTANLVEITAFWNRLPYHADPPKEVELHSCMIHSGEGL